MEGGGGAILMKVVLVCTALMTLTSAVPKVDPQLKFILFLMPSPPLLRTISYISAATSRDKNQFF